MNPEFTLEASYYWSSTTNADYTDNARYLYFDNASTSSNGKTNNDRVICT